MNKKNILPSLPYPAERRYEFREKKDELFLVYRAESVQWALSNLKTVGAARLCGGVFFVTEGKKIRATDDGLEEAEFLIGNLDKGKYYKIDSNVIQTTKSIFIHTDAVKKLSPHLLYVKQPYFGRTPGDGSERNNVTSNIKNIPLLPQIDRLFIQPIKIGGVDEDSIPVEYLLQALRVFPDGKEVRRYMDMRISHILDEYISPKKNFGEYRDNLISHREKVNAIKKKGESFRDVTKQQRIDIYSFALKELDRMLKDATSYREEEWQRMILDIILLLYPKYILAEQRVQVNTDDGKKFLDIALFDAGGFIDVIEIKKPEVGGIGVLKRGLYRDNYVPSRELAGAIMQLEKYVYWLTRWGKSGEEFLQKKYGKKLPNDTQIRIASPTGLIIFGISSDFNFDQKKDFEIIKRKYKNVAEIITYDDLLSRLKRIIEALRS